MPIYKTNGKAEVCGQALGILCLDEYLPFAPGDVNNASSYNYPVVYKMVPGFHSAKVVEGNYDFLDNMIAAAQELEQQGVRAIMANCGYTISIQEEIANAVSIPVAMSPLVLLPMIAKSISKDKTIGIMAAAAPPMSREFIKKAGIKVENPLTIYGLQDEPGINEMLAACGVGEAGITGRDAAMTLDTNKVEADMVRVAQKMLDEHPNTAAIVFECSDFPPYAKAVLDATGLPVFDANTLANFLYAITHPKSYQGHM